MVFGPSSHQPQRMEKPWGSEMIFAVVSGAYVGKVIRLNAGAAVSLQLHREKTESILVTEGEGVLELGSSTASLREFSLEPGRTAHIPAGMLHRMTALSNLTFIEVSTAHDGWEKDVERIEDLYGRKGSTSS